MKLNFKTTFRSGILLVLIINYCSVNANTYTYVGPDPNDEYGEPLYNLAVNWENNNYPGTNISAGDTVLIKSRCVVPSGFGFVVAGYLELEDDMSGTNEMIVSSQGHINVLASVPILIRAQG